MSVRLVGIWYTDSRVAATWIPRDVAGILSRRRGLPAAGDLSPVSDGNEDPPENTLDASLYSDRHRDRTC